MCFDSGKGEIVVYNPRMQYQKSIKLKTREISDMYLDKRKDLILFSECRK